MVSVIFQSFSQYFVLTNLAISSQRVKFFTLSGNSWGKDSSTGEECLGCGPQEEFYGCADISISPNISAVAPSTDSLNTYPRCGSNSEHSKSPAVQPRMVWTLQPTNRGQIKSRTRPRKIYVDDDNDDDDEDNGDDDDDNELGRRLPWGRRGHTRTISSNLPDLTSRRHQPSSTTTQSRVKNSDFDRKNDDYSLRARMWWSTNSKRPTESNINLHGLTNGRHKPSSTTTQPRVIDSDYNKKNDDYSLRARMWWNANIKRTTETSLVTVNDTGGRHESENISLSVTPPQVQSKSWSYRRDSIRTLAGTFSIVWVVYGLI